MAKGRKIWLFSIPLLEGCIFIVDVKQLVYSTKCRGGGWSSSLSRLLQLVFIRSKHLVLSPPPPPIGCLTPKLVVFFILSTYFLFRCVFFINFSIFYPLTRPYTQPLANLNLRMWPLSTGFLHEYPAAGLALISSSKSCFKNSDIWAICRQACDAPIASICI